MRRRSPSSSHKDRRYRRSRSEDRRSDSRRVEGERDKRREAWLLQQQRERDHEILKQKMIMEYELKREAVRNERKKSDRSHRSPSRNTDGIQHSPKLAIMSEKLETPGGSEPLFRGPSTSSRPTETELRQIKVDIHRNLPGAVDASGELQREIINPDDVKVKRREDEGVTPIFDRVELRPPDKLSLSQDKEHREVKTINFEKSRKENQPLKRRSRSLSSLEDRNRSPRETSRRDRRERSSHHQSRRSQRRSKSSDSSDDDRHRRYRRNGRSDRSEDRDGAYSSSHHRDRKNYSSRRPSSRDRSHSSDRRRESPGLGRLTRIECVREHRRRSRDRRESQRSFERGHSESRPREVPTYPHYIEQIPVPVYYGDFPRPVMMPPMMPMRGPPLMRNRPSFGPRLPFPPRYMTPRFPPPNPRFSRKF